MHRSALLAVKVRRNEHLVSTVSNLTERLDAIEGARAREETADVRKLLGEMKLGASATRDVSAAVSQLTARVDHVERDQGARLDKLAERIDHDASSRFADLAARLEKLEKKAASPTVAAVAPDHDASSRFADLAVRLDKLEKKAASPTVAVVAPDHDASPRFADRAVGSTDWKGRPPRRLSPRSPRPRRPNRSRFRRNSTRSFRTKRPLPSRNRSLRSEATPSSASAMDSPRSEAARVRSRWALAT